VNASISSILEAGRKNRDTKIVEAFRASIKKEDIGSVLMSVVGINGSGKSHLVRWLYHEIVPNDEKYIKLWVPRRADGQKFLIKKLIDDLANLGRRTEIQTRNNSQGIQ
jgi:ABC-type molybdenum transport system ATPase subunit/photorepair protein PhrA